MIYFSYFCLALFLGSGVLLGLAAFRANSGEGILGLDSARGALTALGGQLLLAGLSLPAISQCIGGSAAFAILFGIIILGGPATLSTYYYITVLGGALGRSVYTPEANLPGTETAEIDRARALAARGSPDEAVALVELFLEKQPDNIEALTFLAGLELNRERFKRSAELCRRALEADAAVRATNTGLAEEGRADLITLLADALERTGSRAQAAGAIEKQLETLTVERYRKTLAERAARLRKRL